MAAVYDQGIAHALKGSPATMEAPRRAVLPGRPWLLKGRPALSAEKVMALNVAKISAG